MISKHEEKEDRKFIEHKYYSGYCCKCKKYGVKPSPFYEWVENHRKVRLEKNKKLN